MKKRAISPPFMMKKKTTKRKKRAPPKPHVTEYPPYVPKPKKETREIIPIMRLEQPQLQQFLVSLSKSNSWTETKLLLQSMRNYYLTYSQIGAILHRLSSIEQRINAARILKISLKDVPSNLFMFIQGFASKQEREQLKDIFQPEVAEQKTIEFTVHNASSSSNIRFNASSSSFIKDASQASLL